MCRWILLMRPSCFLPHVLKQRTLSPWMNAASARIGFCATALFIYCSRTAPLRRVPADRDSLRGWLSRTTGRRTKVQDYIAHRHRKSTRGLQSAQRAPCPNRLTCLLRFLPIATHSGEFAEPALKTLRHHALDGRHAFFVVLGKHFAFLMSERHEIHTMERDG